MVALAAASTDILTTGTSGAPLFASVDGEWRLLGLVVVGSSHTYRAMAIAVDLRSHARWIEERMAATVQ